MPRRASSQSEPSKPTTLTQPREEVARRLRDRIELGKQLQGGQSFANPEAYMREVQKWSDYNEELLKRVFSDESMFIEYRSSGGGRLVTEESELPYVYREITDNHLAELESVLERLELVPEPVPRNPAISTPRARDQKKVFVVHGREEGPREAIARFLTRLGFDPIILHEQANQGRTVIEKVEAHSDVGFAVVILTPDDMGNFKGEDSQPRARQNVLLELGYFIGKLTRKRVCTFKVGELEIPSDWRGVIDEPYDTNGGWKQTLARELQAAGYEIDWNLVMRS